MNGMWESAPWIKPGSSATLVTARPPRLPLLHTTTYLNYNLEVGRFNLKA